MKSIEIKVPRKLIKEFYLHPEPYGDFLVILINDMWTDVYYCEDGDFKTTTNDDDLISYLRRNKVQSVEYFYRNGLFSFRKIEKNDRDLLYSWNNKSPLTLNYKVSRVDNRPKKFILCIYWIEVGIIEFKNEHVSAKVYQSKLIDIFKDKDIYVLEIIINEYLRKKQPH